MAYPWRASRLSEKIGSVDDFGGERVTVECRLSGVGRRDLSALGGTTVIRGMLRRAVLATLAAERIDDAEISVTLLDDDAIAELNEWYLSHAGPTDVLSFPLWSEGEKPIGEVCIGFDHALRQATALGVPAAEELVRLAVHGTLHVLGHSHPEDESRTDSTMWKLQERIVAEVVGGG